MQVMWGMGEIQKLSGYEIENGFIMAIDKLSSSIAAV
jgi:hypothetical protein